VSVRVSQVLRALEHSGLRTVWNADAILDSQRLCASPRKCYFFDEENSVTMKIQLSLYNKSGALAAIVADDGRSLDIAVNRTSRSAKTICKRAAATLRNLADKFEVLAETEEPFKIATQRQVNNSKGSSAHGKEA
jgi:hypothetical protein